jgi:hypothetical protein
VVSQNKLTNRVPGVPEGYLRGFGTPFFVIITIPIPI